MHNLYSNRINTLKTFGVVLFLVFFNIKVFAQSVWIGGTGNWNVAANWSPSGVPGAATDVIVNSGSPNLNGIAATMKNLTVNGVTLTINNSNFTVNGTTTVTGNGNGKWYASR